jgi:hypothetical protein
MKVKRISFREGWFDFWARIYGFDSMFPRTIKDLTLRPGVAAKRYIDGNRAAYYGPVGYYFLMITLMLLVVSLLGMDFSEVMLGRSRDIVGNVPENNSPLSERQREFQQLVLDNFKIFTFLLVFFQAMWLRVFFRKSGYNVLEHSVMAFFTAGHMYWLTIADLVVMKIFGKGLHLAIPLTVSMLFFSYGASQLYSYQSRFKAFLKGILSWLTGYVTFAIFIVIVTVIFLLIKR